MQVASSIESVPGQYWNWRNEPVYYVRMGERKNRPPLLLIHGFGASTDHWRKNVIGLSSEFEVWAIDLLGFGRSSKPDWRYSGELWRDQIHEFMNEVIGAPAVLAGNSLGGYVALTVASQRPESAAGLILINSAGPFTDIQGTTKPDPIRQVMGSFVMTLFHQDWASWLLFQYVRQKSVIRNTLQKVYLDQSAVTDRLIEEIQRPAFDTGAEKVFASVFRTPQGEKVDVLLHQLTRPLLMLWGEGDPWINARERGAKFRSYHPQLTEYYLDAGHCPHDEIPDHVNQLIQDWVVDQVIQA
ncbi:alpha/beta fold hydrolase [Cyanobacteria bacterium FACHB-DQ100]|uniref:alpha/beta fold hydrolase n=1 Tax=unclassified Leptolyngbya TaxID=2650499 RepID=UPI001680A8BD|nr:alpha/beta fold hydrolase [Leptolyngbya sp. FACHB-17]MBD1823412.1 alpha/beta fold hydrolase [Cyanobacteria bacterium FACHB-DQ100]MBD2083302.1 alpha/beta fold hydrolase [Leptolyngbya sp. FACHB-17]